MFSLSLRPRTRYPPNSPGPEPEDEEELLARVQERNVQCTCAEDYGEATCKEPHNEIVVPVSEGPRELLGPTYQVSHLMNATIQYFSRPEADMSPAQKQAIGEFRDMQQRRPLLWARYAHIPGTEAVTTAEMEWLMSLFNTIFFFGALDVKFQWETTSDGTTLGFYRSDTRTVHVDDRSDYTWDDPRGPFPARDSRIDTLLHECVHALVEQFACKQCDSFAAEYDNAHGHGRVFQLLSATMFKMARRLLDVRSVECDWASEFVSNWDCVTHFPSVHDAEEWRRVAVIERGFSGPRLEEMPDDPLAIEAEIQNDIRVCSGRDPYTSLRDDEARLGRRPGGNTLSRWAMPSLSEFVSRAHVPTLGLWIGVFSCMIWMVMFYW